MSLLYHLLNLATTNKTPQVASLPLGAFPTDPFRQASGSGGYDAKQLKLETVAAGASETSVRMYHGSFEGRWAN